MTLAQRSGLQTAARQAAVQALLQRLQQGDIHRVRVAWCDLHGQFRCKTLLCRDQTEGLAAALNDGVGMVSTVLLKDSSDRTAFAVFEPDALQALPGFGAANNLLLLPDPASFAVLPWAPHTGWLRADSFWADGTAVQADPRGVLQRALAELAAAGLALRCGLELEFHVYRIVSDATRPDEAHWPGEPPEVQLLHPGYCLLGEAHGDRAHQALELIADTALGLGLPLRSLEIEMGPSQFEAVFAATDALTAADHMVRFRSAVRQALARHGLYASFVCKPPFAGAVASGWHIHQSLVDLQGRPVMHPPARTGDTSHGPDHPTGDAARWLSPTGVHWLAGLLAHSAGMTALCAPSITAYSRFAGSMMAPQAAVWALDNRGAMLRVICGASDEEAHHTRIENRIAEPLANPYLALASQVLAGLHGLRGQLAAAPACETPYASDAPPLPTTLAQALDALAADAVLRGGLGEPLHTVYQAVKQQELKRHAQAADPAVWERREYFARA